MSISLCASHALVHECVSVIVRVCMCAKLRALMRVRVSVIVRVRILRHRIVRAHASIISYLR